MSVYLSGKPGYVSVYLSGKPSYVSVYLSGKPSSGENVPDVVSGIRVQQSLRLEERRSVQSLVLSEDAQDSRWGHTQTKGLIGVI